LLNRTKSGAVQWLRWATCGWKSGRRRSQADRVFKSVIPTSLKKAPMTMLSLASLVAWARWPRSWLRMMVTNRTEMGRNPNWPKNSRDM
jgi:hypothetical protein